MRGLSEAYGSWKMICSARRYARIAPSAQRRQVDAVEADRARSRLDAAAARAGPSSTCRSPIRRPARASRRPRASKLDAVDRVHGVRRRAEEAAPHREVLDEPSTRRSGVATQALDYLRATRFGADSRLGAALRAHAGPRAARASTRLRVPGRARRSGGSSRRQRSIANGQRGWKRQPRNGVSGLGTWPSIAASRSCSRCSRGIEPSRPIVYGCCGSGEQRGDRRALDDPAGVHHRDVVGDLGDHAEIVRDEDDRGAGLLAQRAHQVEDLRLDRDVERGGRLVGDQQLRPARQRHRDHHALAHAAREPVRIVVEALLGRRDAHAAQHLDRLRLRLRARQLAGGAGCTSTIWSPTVNAGLSEVIGSWKIIEMRLPRSSRISAVGQLEQVDALEQDLAAGDAPGRLRHEAHDRQRRDALAAARLADDAERAARFEREAHAVDGGELAALRR